MKKLFVNGMGGYAFLVVFPLFFLACDRSFAAAPDPAEIFRSARRR